MNRREALPLGMLITMALVGIALMTIDPRAAGAALKAEIDAGRVKDALQAIVFVESFKSKVNLAPMLTTVSVATVPLLVAATAPFLAYVFPSYVFYWADNEARYDCARKMKKIFWTAGVLAVVVGLATDYLKKLVGW